MDRICIFEFKNFDSEFKEKFRIQNHFFRDLIFTDLCVGIDVFSQRGMLKMIRLSGLSVSGFLGFLTLILANKFVKMKEKLKSWNSVLETAIRERTKKSERTTIWRLLLNHTSFPTLFIQKFRNQLCTNRYT